MKVLALLLALALVPAAAGQDNETSEQPEPGSADDGGWNPFWVTIIAVAVLGLVAIIILAARR